MRRICLALPDTKETPTWGQPHFRVGEKIFSGLGEEKGVLTVGVKLEMDHADAMVRRPGFSRAPYVGHKGWVSIDVETVGQAQQIYEHVGELEPHALPPLGVERAALLFGQPLELFDELGGFDRQRHREILRRMKLLPVARGRKSG